MFTVTGTIDSVPYRVGVHDSTDGLTLDALGVVMGSDNAIDHLRLHEGQSFQETPTHAPATLDTKDPASVLGFLRGTTQVDDVTPAEGSTVPETSEQDDPRTVH